MPIPTRRKPRLGCFGQLIAFFVVGTIAVLAITAVFAPWGFYLGGTFHIIPYWQGWGRLHSKTGDYVVFVRFEPSPGGRLGTYVKGTAYLCTPRGEKFQLRLGGSMRLKLNLSTDGEAIRLGMYRWSTWKGMSSPPKIELRGRWQNPNLVMDDAGTIAYAFLPDGSVYVGHDPNRPYGHDPLPITLTEGSYSEFESACVVQRR